MRSPNSPPRTPFPKVKLPPDVASIFDFDPPANSQSTDHQAKESKAEVPYTLPVPPQRPPQKKTGSTGSQTPKKENNESSTSSEDWLESSPDTPTPKSKKNLLLPIEALTLEPNSGCRPKTDRHSDTDSDSDTNGGPAARGTSSSEGTRRQESKQPASENNSNNTKDTMSKSKEGQSETYHQEYIASLRYRNDLPPPEMPPKLLGIPHAGFARFLTPGYTSNMARREEPNIDVDAEGGMPIDLVGIPGLHLGDESAIMAPENPPPVAAADLSLLMTPEQLRNPAPKETHVSFLRRTQYISGGRSSNPNVPVSPAKARPRPQNKAKMSQDDPDYIKKFIQKGFDIAYPDSKHTGEDSASMIKGLPVTKAEHDAWATPTHPDNPKLKPVGIYPILPDLQGFPDPGGYVQFKFDKPPISGDVVKNDKRMEVSILQPAEPDERISQEYATKLSLHKTNPDRYPDPGPMPYDYHLYLPEKKESAKNILASLSESNPNRDDPNLYTNEGPDGVKFHRYDHVRTYATNAQTLNVGDKQKDAALVFHDPDTVKENEQENVSVRQKAVYYSPILAKTRLTQRRTRAIAKAGLAPTTPGASEERADQLQLTIRDPDEAETYKRSLHRASIDPKFGKTMPPPPVSAEEPEGQEGQDQDQDQENAEGEELAES